MKRTKKIKEASAILTSDLHLTDKTPVARIDDYILAQRRKLLFLSDLSAKNGYCPVLCSGDIFDYWKASPWLLGFAYEYLPRPFICIPGQHDLPMHSLEQFDRSALGLLAAVDDNIHVITNPKNPIFTKMDLWVVGFPFGVNKQSATGCINPHVIFKRMIVMSHELVWQKEDKPTWAHNIGASPVSQLLHEFEDCDLILTGDNHKNFTEAEDGTLLVNPGSMMRATADQENTQPQCYLYFADDNSVQAVDYPIEKGVHQRDHLDRVAERDNRIAAYIERINTDWKLGVSFRNNLESFFNENKTAPPIKEIVYTALDKGE